MTSMPYQMPNINYTRKSYNEEDSEAVRRSLGRAGIKRPQAQFNKLR